ncbi:MAG: hypothetical protein Q9180_003068, partial [Flavoplaca navasiana]
SQHFQDVDLAFNVTLESTKTVGLLFGQQGQALNFSKRAVNYQEAVCKGGELGDMVQEAFEGRRPPGPSFCRNELGLPPGRPQPEQGTINIYVPSYNAILAKYVESTKYLQGKRKVPVGNIPSVVPPLNRLFDMSWLMYSKYAPNPARLRYIGNHFISNPESSDIIDQMLKATYNTCTPNIAWPGLQASINTDPSKALLATPNGVGVA